MGLYNLQNPRRAGNDVAKYDGWALVNIIGDFVKQDLTIERNRVLFRRAILISDEYKRAMVGGRINV